MTLTLSPYIGAVIAKAKIAPAPLVAKLSGVLALRFMRAAFRDIGFVGYPNRSRRKPPNERVGTR